MNKKSLLGTENRWVLLLLSGTSLLAYGGLVMLDARYGTLRGAMTPQAIAWFGLAFFSYLGLLIAGEKWGISIRWMWGGAILFRVMLLVTTPTLSDDVYRYMWDGYVANEGVSPYAHAINAAELDYLDIPQRALANNAWMASPYLPAAQVVFYGSAAVFPLQPVFLQAMMVVFELGAAWILAKLLAMALLPPSRLFIYLWNPLVIVEVAHGGHIDGWMILLALLGVYFGLRGKGGNSQQSTINGEQSTKNNQQPTTNSQQLTIKSEQLTENNIRSTANNQQLTINNQQLSVNRKDFSWVLSPLFLGLATLTKILPVLLLPVVFWLWSWRQRVFYGLLLVVLLVPFGLQAGWGLWGELDGVGLFGALRIYGSVWNFNSGLFHWLEIGLGKMDIENSIAGAKGIVGLLLLMLMTAVWFVARKHTAPRSALRLMSVPLMGYALLTPTLHPWYILLLLAFLPFLTPAEEESRWMWLLVAPWLYLSGALIFSYLTYLDPLNFGELDWVRQLEWLPTLAMVATAGIVTAILRVSSNAAK